MINFNLYFEQQTNRIYYIFENDTPFTKIVITFEPIMPQEPALHFWNPIDQTFQPIYESMHKKV